MIDEIKRGMLATTALGQAIEGAHYLLGGWGGIPGGPDEHGRAVKLIEHHAYETLAIHTAKNGKQTCYGRWGEAGGYLFPATTTTSTNLKKYIAENSSLDDWAYFDKPNLFPRRLHGADSTIALGEDCRNKRHFDCIGFIYWVLRQYNKTVTWNNHNISSFEKGFKEVEKLGQCTSSQLSIGDIVTRTNTTPHHIGFYIGFDRVVHASIENRGVVISPYGSGNWTGAARLKEGIL